MDLDSVPALVTPGIGLVGSQVKVSRKRAPPGKRSQVFPAQDLPGQLWALQLKLWVPGGCYRFKDCIFSYHPVFQTCQVKKGRVLHQVRLLRQDPWVPIALAWPETSESTLY